MKPVRLNWSFGFWVFPSLQHGVFIWVFHFKYLLNTRRWLTCSTQRSGQTGHLSSAIKSSAGPVLSGQTLHLLGERVCLLVLLAPTSFTKRLFGFCCTTVVAFVWVRTQRLKLTSELLTTFWRTVRETFLLEQDGEQTTDLGMGIARGRISGVVITLWN